VAGEIESRGQTIRLYDCDHADVNDVTSDHQFCYAGCRKKDGSGVARKFDIITGDLVKEFVGHEEGITAVGLYGAHLFTASQDHTARKWNTETGECEIIFKGHTSEIFCLDASRGTLWTAGNDERKAVKCWNIKSEVPSLEFHDAYLGDAVNALAVASTCVYVCTCRGTVHEYSSSSGMEVRKYVHPCTFVFGMCYTKGRLFLVGRRGNDTEMPTATAMFAEVQLDYEGIVGGGLASASRLCW